MKGTVGNAGLVAAGVLLVCSAAVSQVAPTQTGHKLDRNMQIGSGGYNTPSGGSGGVNSQLYVTGLITGGVGQIQTGRILDRNLQIGSGGYNVVNGGIGGVNTELFINRQVHSLGLFRGDVPYYRLRRMPAAIRTPGAVAQDFHKMIDPALAKSLYTDATADYASVARIPPGRGISAVVPLAPLDTRTDLTPKAPAPQTPPDRPGASAPFSLLWQEDRLKLAVELQQLPMDHRIDARVEPQARPSGRTDRSSDGLVSVEAGPSGTTRTTPVKLFEPDQDVFMDILAELRDLHRSVAAKAAGLPPEQKPGTTTAPAKEGVVKKTKDERMIIVHALAGRRRTNFNLYLKKGQSLLKGEKYYSAAGQFELAAIALPTNPLARVGWGLAMLAAGEPLSAAVHFRAAIEIFPPLMETRFNFKEMIAPDHLNRRPTEVNSRLNAQAKPDAMLAFLATYLPFNARHAVDSKYYAGKLSEAAGNDKILAAYARFVLTGKRPDQAENNAGKK